MASTAKFAVVGKIAKRREILTLDSKGDACYELKDVTFQRPAEGIVMDLDGTTLDSEGFWVCIIRLTMAKLMGDPKFTLEDADEPFVSGYTTVEHLRYCINKYCKDKKIEDANAIYHITASEELEKVMNGTGNANAFRPNEGLKEFLLEVKRRGIKIGLATSGLKYKAIPEIVSVFRQLDMGDPLKFYDSFLITFITATNTRREWVATASPKCTFSPRR